MNEDKVIKLVAPHIVKIETPTGFGTGFLFHYDHNEACYAVATAASVVAHAKEHGQPIKVTHGHTGTHEVLSSGSVFIDECPAGAILLCNKDRLRLPKRPLSLLPIHETCGSDVEIGWFGYPTLVPDTPCFFAGRISAHLDCCKTYIIDGASAVGRGGAPVFRLLRSGNVQIIGFISTEWAIRAAGSALSGRVRANDVSNLWRSVRLFQLEV